MIVMIVNHETVMLSRDFRKFSTGDSLWTRLVSNGKYHGLFLDQRPSDQQQSSFLRASSEFNIGAPTKSSQLLDQALLTTTTWHFVRRHLQSWWVFRPSNRQLSCQTQHRPNGWNKTKCRQCLENLNRPRLRMTIQMKSHQQCLRREEERETQGARNTGARSKFHILSLCQNLWWFPIIHRKEREANEETELEVIKRRNMFLKKEEQRLNDMKKKMQECYMSLIRQKKIRFQ